MKKIKTSLAIAVGTGLMGGLTGLNVQANPFEMQELSSGYMQLAVADAVKTKAKTPEAKCAGDKPMTGPKTVEAKCGEGVCSSGMKKDHASPKAAESKCGEGKCSADMKKDPAAPKAAESKCGAGKCGANMKADDAKK